MANGTGDSSFLRVNLLAIVVGGMLISAAQAQQTPYPSPNQTYPGTPPAYPTPTYPSPNPTYPAPPSSYPYPAPNQGYPGNGQPYQGYPGMNPAPPQPHFVRDLFAGTLAAVLQTLTGGLVGSIGGRIMDWFTHKGQNPSTGYNNGAVYAGGSQYPAPGYGAPSAYPPTTPAYPGTAYPSNSSAAYPTYQSQTSAYPTPPAAYPNPAYPNGAPATSAYPNPAYPTAAYPSGAPATSAYPSPAYPNGATATSAYPSPAYPNGATATSAYPNPTYPNGAPATSAYPNPAYPTAAYPNGAPATSAYPNPAYPNGATATSAYPNPAYPNGATATSAYPNPAYPNGATATAAYPSTAYPSPPGAAAAAPYGATAYAAAPMQVYDAHTGQIVTGANPYTTRGTAMESAIYAGIAYEVHTISADGHTTPINTATIEFHTGDKFMVYYRPSLPGHMEIYNVNPAGQQTLIDSSNMAAGQMVGLGPYQFTNLKGDETLRLVLSPCSTPQLLAQTRDIVRMDAPPQATPTSGGLQLASCGAPTPRGLDVHTRDIQKVAVEGTTSFALDPVSPQELSSGQVTPREATIVFHHR